MFRPPVLGIPPLQSASPAQNLGQRCRFRVWPQSLISAVRGQAWGGEAVARPGGAACRKQSRKEARRPSGLRPRRPRAASPPRAPGCFSNRAGHQPGSRPSLRAAHPACPSAVAVGNSRGSVSWPLSPRRPAPRAWTGALSDLRARGGARGRGSGRGGPMGDPRPFLIAAPGPSRGSQRSQCACTRVYPTDVAPCSLCQALP